MGVLLTTYDPLALYFPVVDPGMVFRRRDLIMLSLSNMDIPRSLRCTRQYQHGAIASVRIPRPEHPSGPGMRRPRDRRRPDPAIREWSTEDGERVLNPRRCACIRYSLMYPRHLSSLA